MVDDSFANLEAAEVVENSFRSTAPAVPFLNANRPMGVAVDTYGSPRFFSIRTAKVQPD